MKGTFSALKINNKIQKKMRIQGYKTPIFPPPPRNEGLNKGLLTTKSGGFPGEKALFSKKLEIFHGSFCPNLLVLDGFTLRCCGRSLALPHSQGWLCGGLVPNHPEMSGLCWDMLGYVGFWKTSNLWLAKTHNFRKAMRKNYIHARNKVYGSMDGLQAFCLFRKGMFSEELYLREKAVLYWKTWKILPLVSLIGYRNPLKREASTRWWFQIFFIFTPIWGRFPFWLIFFRWVETTNQRSI